MPTLTVFTAPALTQYTFPTNGTVSTSPVGHMYYVVTDDSGTPHSSRTLIFAASAPPGRHDRRSR